MKFLIFLQLPWGGLKLLENRATRFDFRVGLYGDRSLIGSFFYSGEYV